MVHAFPGFPNVFGREFKSENIIHALSEFIDLLILSNQYLSLSTEITFLMFGRLQASYTIVSTLYLTVLSYEGDLRKDLLLCVSENQNVITTSDLKLTD